MKNLLKIWSRLGISDQAKTIVSGGTCNLPELDDDKPYLDKILLPNYPISHMLYNRFDISIDCNKVNRRANAYLTYQTRRLWRNRGNPVLFFVIAKSLIFRSKAFRVALLNKSIKGWYQNKRLLKIIAILKRFPKLRDKVNVKSSRFYVPKKNGKLRPIGSPEASWKMVLTGWAWAMSVYVSDKISDRQHAFRPGRGLWTIWLEILTVVREFNNIYEYDLTSFFNSVRLRKTEHKNPKHWTSKLIKLNSLEAILEKFNIPKDIIEMIIRFNTNHPRVPKDGEVEMRDPELWEKVNPGYHYYRTGKKTRWEDAIQTGRSHSRWGSPRLNRDYGYTQGSPLSPILSIMVLDKWQKLKLSVHKTIMYADDGLIYNSNKREYLRVPNVNSPTSHTVDDDIGVSINEKKSGMVKLNGEYLKNLEFCGSVYNPFEDTLNGIPLSDLTEKNLFKIVGKVYGVKTTAEEWDWEYVKDSMLFMLNRRHTAYRYVLGWFYRIFLPSGYKKWDYDLPIKDASTICTSLLLDGFKRYQIRFNNLKFNRRS